MATLTSSLAAENAKPDMIEISAWGPALSVVGALRKFAPNAGPSQR
jgi:hypothetical protein